jgi:hypothetical protein
MLKVHYLVTTITTVPTVTMAIKVTTATAF